MDFPGTDLPCAVGVFICQVMIFKKYTIPNYDKSCFPFKYDSSIFYVIRNENKTLREPHFLRFINKPGSIDYCFGSVWSIYVGSGRWDGHVRYKRLGVKLNIIRNIKT